jgi:hypothetical protein
MVSEYLDRSGSQKLEDPALTKIKYELSLPPKISLKYFFSYSISEEFIASLHRKIFLLFSC